MSRLQTSFYHIWATREERLKASFLWIVRTGGELENWEIEDNANSLDESF